MTTRDPGGTTTASIREAALEDGAMPRSDDAG